MGVWWRYSLVRNVEPGQAKALIEEVAREALPGPKPSHSRYARWQPQLVTRELRCLQRGDVLAMTDEAWVLAGAISKRVNGPHIEVRVQGDYWDMSVYAGGFVVADFSTRIGALADDRATRRPWKRGGVEDLVRVWGCEREAVEPYLIDWDALEAPVWARPGDRSPAGEWAQVADFLRALGADEPNAHADRFTVQVPAWESKPVELPLCRREGVAEAARRPARPPAAEEGRARPVEAAQGERACGAHGA